MLRTKLVLKLIESEKKRKATYKNRRDGLLQKVSQFATLCGVEAFLICFGPAVAGGEVTTWPADRDTVLRRIEKLRNLRPEKIRQVHTTSSLLCEDLAKQQLALLKVQQCGVDDLLMPSGYRFDELSLDGLNALYDTLSETLERARRRMAALRGGDVVGHVDHHHDHDDDASSSALALPVPAPAPYAVALPENAAAFDFPFGLSGSIDAHYYYPVHDTMQLPLPVHGQTPCLAYHLPPSCLSYQMPPPPLAAAPFDQGMSCTGFMGSNLYATNVVHGDATLFDDYSQGFAAGAGYGNDLLAHGFAFAAGTGYDTADVWPMNTLNNPNDGVAFQLQNDLKGLLPGGGSSGSNLQGGF